MNVLLVTADQWRGDCLSCAGHPAARTPNLDRLAADGVRFARHFTNATPCGPARASLHTGLYALNHRSVTNGTPLDARHRTLASLVRESGRDPVLFGYTDTSADPRALPPGSPWLRTYEGVAPGFRAELRLPEAEEPYLEHLAARGYGRLGYRDVYGGGFDRPAPFRAEDSVTAFLADRFLDWHAGRRDGWFAHLSFLKPHPPFVAAEPWFSLVSPKDAPPPARAPTPEAEAALHPWLAAHLAQPVAGSPANGRGRVDRRELLAPGRLARLRAVYLGLVAEVDHHLGRILEALARRGQLDRTLVAFTADHGEMLGDRWMLGKAGFFPQAFHVPLIVRHPGGARGRVVDGAFTEHVDLMPTVLAALGLRAPLQCDGASLLPFLAGEGAPASWRAAAHWEHDFRDVVERTYETALGLPSDDCALAVRFDGRRAYVHFAALPALCFDAERDPHWRADVAAEPARAPEVLALAQAMLSWRMRAAERRLTGCALTPAGVVGRYG